ncbi:transposase family protein [Shewanella waksmanii]|uniref:transposase family protein n=1 Tax=Shewanella waksmanii TaxID=213783 RepID=UPI003735676B
MALLRSYTPFCGVPQSLDVFQQYFSGIKDHRQSAKITHLLFDVFLLTVCAVIAGCESWEEIEDLGEFRQDWLKAKRLFENSIPAHDTIAHH